MKLLFHFVRCLIFRQRSSSTFSLLFISYNINIQNKYDPGALSGMNLRYVISILYSRHLCFRLLSFFGDSTPGTDISPPFFINNCCNLIRNILYSFPLWRLWDNIHITLQSMNKSNHYYKIFLSFYIPFIFRC